MTLEHLWAGWRSDYVATATSESSPAGGSEDGGCVFCRIMSSGEPSQDNGIVWMDEISCALLNAYPYTTGHLLVMPRRHLSGLDELTWGESSSLWEATRTAVAVLGKAYGPDGANIGANLGRAAGAGIPAHLHLHVLPRWSGDTNFMTAVAGVRVMPESLTDTWTKLHRAWSSV
jgi:diadenosine tetraphosphate (Ap4A) HIT family hydrolase